MADRPKLWCSNTTNVTSSYGWPYGTEYGWQKMVPDDTAVRTRSIDPAVGWATWTWDKSAHHWARSPIYTDDELDWSAYDVQVPMSMSTAEVLGLPTENWPVGLTVQHPEAFAPERYRWDGEKFVSLVHVEPDNWNTFA